VMTKAAAVFSSRLAHVLKRYVDLKRALGRRFDETHRTILLVARQAPAHEGREAETASAGFPSEKVGLSIAREFPLG
jgi:hypothetical protein